jgi:gliding motility-associated-like protein
MNFTHNITQDPNNSGNSLGIWPKFSIFDRLHKANTPKMKGFITIMKSALLTLVAAFAMIGDTAAQCTIQYNGSPCVGTPVSFYGEAAGTTHDWDFNGEGSQTGLKNLNFAFKTAGNKTITYITTINGTKCTSTLNLVVRTAPTIKLKLQNLYEQCFEKNLFCFTDSSFNKNGSKIAKIRYLVSDGQLFEYTKPTMPQTFCFSVKDERGGSFDIFVEVTDEWGCVDTMKLTGAVKVREKIGARFTSNKPVACDSVTATIQNISRIDKSQVKKITWYWGDGSTSTDWGPTIKKTFYGQGTYNSKVVIETIDGCKDSFTVTAAASVFKSKATIWASKDSACISDAKIDFGVDQVPAGATGLLWNFGDPNTGPQNFDNKSWNTSHGFSGLGPFLINLTYSHPICGNKSAYDTIIVLGPVSTIEVSGNRLAEFEVFQCPKDVMDTVHFKNFSTFYHNDRDFTDDDSTFYKWNGTLGHTFQKNANGTPRQVWQKPLRNEKNSNGTKSVYAGGTIAPAGGNDYLKRERVCAVRLWDFSDTYAPKCTTDVTRNKNVFVNCQYSRDTLPTHYYKSWDLILLERFKTSPMEDAIFITSTGLCKKIQVWASDTLWVVLDTIVFVPKTSADSATAATTKYKNAIKKYAPYYKMKGIGERLVEDSVTITLGAKDSVYINKTLYVGPKTVLAKDKDIIRLTSKTDSIVYNFYAYTRRDTLPLPLLKIRLAKGEKPTQLKMLLMSKMGRFNGLNYGTDYIIDYKRYRDLYYSKIPQCNNVKLNHKDTCHPMKCEHEATKTLAMLHANAGGVGSGLLKDAIECLGAKNPQYGITFILSDLKPGCTFSMVEINFDSTCNPNGWVALSGLSPGSRPPGPPYPGYQMAGNPPSRYSKQYSASQVCDPSGCITVGIVVGNGVRKPGTFSPPTKDRPICSDTQWYRQFACFPMIDPAFEVIIPKPNSVGIRKICKGDPVIVRPIPGNKTKTDDLKSLRWSFETGNASPSYSRGWRRYIQEDYFRYQQIPGKNPKRLYNYVVQTRGGEDPVQVPCTDIWNDGNTKITKRDTIYTAEIRAWTVGADVSAVWDRMKERLDARGFDPFSLSPAQIAQMIWNNKGVIGQPSSGAYGCIDTTGFGRFIRYYFIPNKDSMTILHYRDTTIRPTDINKVSGVDYPSYRFIPKWVGYHLVSVSMTSSNGKCDDIAAFPVLVGFAMELELPDSIICQDQATSLKALPKYKMFHPDPINFGTWDFTDYWRDPTRQAETAQGKPNREPFTKWDWNKADDDASKPITIFGGQPWGGTGVGSAVSPWVDLGGGGSVAKYYKDDSGVYVFRNIAGDSTGCMDTVTRKLFITRLDVRFNLNVTVPSCNTAIEFFDSSIMHDPCSWAMKNCNGPTPMQCDYIKEWYIDWGDSSNNLFKRSASNQSGLPDRIGHKYTRNGWFKIQYRLKTDQGCEDTFSRWILIPGPRPRFEFTTKAGNQITICEGDSLQFSNLTDTASSKSDWTWFWGDGKIDNKKDQFLYHTYTKPGKYYVFLQQYDSLILPPNIRKFCPATFPDTPSQKAFIVTVLPRDSVRGLVLKMAICVGDSNYFTDNSDTILKSYKWRFENLSTGQVDTVTTDKKKMAWRFNTPGRIRVSHFADYDPSHPRPWCPTVMGDIIFLVDSVVSNFTIDSSKTPDYTYTRTDVNGTQWRWGYNHQSNIKLTKEPLIVDYAGSDKVVSASYSGTDTFWICLEVTNSTGCKDTVCKPVYVNQFILLANVFTPGNGDGKNDEFRVPIAGQSLFELRIYNRYGERVFESSDPGVKWNGKVNNDGAEVPSGTYFYQLTYQFKGKDKINKVNGSVNVIRKAP